MLIAIVKRRQNLRRTEALCSIPSSRQGAEKRKAAWPVAVSVRRHAAIDVRLPPAGARLSTVFSCELALGCDAIGPGMRGVGPGRRNGRGAAWLGVG
jgi:hypothetical protein